MKKFLLFAVAALTAATMSAQLLTKQQTNLRPVKAQSAARIDKSKVTKLSLDDIKAVTNVGKPVIAGRDLRAMSKKTALRPFRGVQNLSAAQISLRKAPASALAEYNAKGLEVDLANQKYAGYQTWTMVGGEDAAGGLYLGDVILNTIGGDSPIWAQYEIVEDLLVIPAQPVADLSLSVGDVTLWLCSYPFEEDADGSIILNIDEEGELTPMSDIEWYCYMAFNKGAEFDPTLKSEDYLGYWEIFEGTTYSTPGVPVASIYPEGLYLNASIGYNGYAYSGANLSIIPAYAPVNFINFTTEATQYAWSVNSLEYVDGNMEIDETFEGDEETFSYTTVGGAVYDAVTLTASNARGESTYAWGSQFEGKPHYAYAGEMAENLAFDDDIMPIVGLANWDFSIAYHTGLATPGSNASGKVMSDLILYQGKPSAPLYCEGINMLVKDFSVNSVNSEEGEDSEEGAEGELELTCGIYKATRTASGSIALGELIAESSTVEALTDYITELRWTDFYVYDEDGMTEGIDHLFIEDECAIVISGWDNGTFEATPWVEYEQNEAGNSYTFFRLNMDGYDNEDIYRFTGAYYKMYVGFYEAIYGWLQTDDDTNLSIPAEGGEASIHVSPMLYNGGNAENKTRLFLEDDEMPEWFEIYIANEEYTADNFGFDLVVVADALPEGETARSAEFTVWQEGAKLTVTVNQGGDDAITTTTATVVRDGKAYNLAGQKVSKAQKGLVVAGGKKMINK